MSQLMTSFRTGIYTAEGAFRLATIVPSIYSYDIRINLLGDQPSAASVPYDDQRGYLANQMVRVSLDDTDVPVTTFAHNNAPSFSKLRALGVVTGQMLGGMVKNIQQYQDRLRAEVTFDQVSTDSGIIKADIRAYEKLRAEPMAQTLVRTGVLKNVQQYQERLRGSVFTTGQMTCNVKIQIADEVRALYGEIPSSIVEMRDDVRHANLNWAERLRGYSYGEATARADVRTSLADLERLRTFFAHADIVMPSTQKQNSNHLVRLRIDPFPTDLYDYARADLRQLNLWNMLFRYRAYIDLSNHAEGRSGVRYDDWNVLLNRYRAYIDVEDQTVDANSGLDPDWWVYLKNRYRTTTETFEPDFETQMHSDPDFDVWKWTQPQFRTDGTQDEFIGHATTTDGNTSVSVLLARRTETLGRVFDAQAVASPRVVVEDPMIIGVANETTASTSHADVIATERVTIQQTLPS